MLGGNTNNTFHVDHYSGDIYLVKQLDYDEGPKSYKLLVIIKNVYFHSLKRKRYLFLERAVQIFFFLNALKL